MSTFRLFDNRWGWTESGFRSKYGKDVREMVMQCCSGLGEDNQCKSECHFLVADGIWNVDEDECFPIFGVDCDVEVPSGGDDVDNATIFAYCKECAAAMHKFRFEQEREQKIEIEKRIELERRERTEKEKKQRALLDHWNKLSDRRFEQQCAQLFNDLGFKSELTPLTNDGGIDILLEKDGKRGAAQCKAWNQPCGVKEAREFYGVVISEKLTFGYFISKSGFTESAAEFLKKTGLVQAWSINSLVENTLNLNSENSVDSV